MDNLNDNLEMEQCGIYGVKRVRMLLCYIPFTGTN